MIKLSLAFTPDLKQRILTKLGVHQLPVTMRGPEGLLCFLTRTTTGGGAISYLYTCSL